MKRRALLVLGLRRVRIPSHTFPSLIQKRFQTTTPPQTLIIDKFKPSKQNDKCSSCGVQLQTSSKDLIGYYNKPKTASSRPSSKSLQFKSAFSKLDTNGKALLNFSEYEIPNDHQQEQEDLICKRCHDGLYHSIYDIDSNKPLNFDQVMDLIPYHDKDHKNYDVNFLYVSSMVDFPLSLMNLNNLTNINYIVNKTDLIFGHSSSINKYQTYFNELIYRLTGQRKNIHMISSFTNWNIPSLIKTLKSVNYLIGYVNTGKSRLMNKIINLSKPFKQSDTKPIGSSHLPALTRDLIPHKIDSSRTIIDVPGFLDEEFGVYKHLLPSTLKHVLKGKKLMIMNNNSKLKYHSIRNQQVFTTGGLFFIKPPKDTIVQIVPIINGESKIFHDLDKAINIIKETPKALENFKMVKSEAMDDLVRYVIPPFIGKIDLLIKDVGYVQITPTGALLNEEDLFEVWAPKGVVLGIRESIQHFLTGYIKTKETVQKSKKTKEKFKLKPKPIPNYKIFTKLYEIDKNSTDPFTDMEISYNKHIRENNGISFLKHHSQDFRDDSRNKYWIEKL